MYIYRFIYDLARYRASSLIHNILVTLQKIFFEFLLELKSSQENIISLILVSWLITVSLIKCIVRNMRNISTISSLETATSLAELCFTLRHSVLQVRETLYQLQSHHLTHCDHHCCQLLALLSCTVASTIWVSQSWAAAVSKSCLSHWAGPSLQSLTN